jgi:protein gp37
MAGTKIEWADAVWNPVTGCTPISEGCVNCYAARMAKRLAGRFGYPPGDPFRVTIHQDRLMEPHKWKKARRVFVCSMGDLFHAHVRFENIRVILAHMLRPRGRKEWHTFLILTKRPDRMAEFFTWMQSQERSFTIEWPQDHIWLGTTVENQDRTDRISTLLKIPAAKHFVSLEPLLGPVDVSPYLPGCYECNMTCGFRGGENYIPDYQCIKCGHEAPMGDPTWGNDPSFYRCPECDYETDDYEKPCPDCSEGELVQYHPDIACLDWVIVGGETGPGARPMHPDWIRSVRDQCQAAGVPFFFKGWGMWVPKLHRCCDSPAKFSSWGILDIDGNWFPETTPWNGRQGEESETREYVMFKVGKKAAGHLLDGREWNEFPK